jgi:hypothetical protein
VTEAQTALARRAIACTGWRWSPGMLAVDLQTRSEARVMPGTMNLIVRYLEGDRYVGGSVPALTDPATLGCLLALVREVWGMPTGITVTYSSDEGLWGVSWSGATHGGCCGRGETEGEALVAALESAP